MCGIVGCVLKQHQSSGFNKKQEDTFLQLLHADQLRGEDSTGIVGIERDTTFHIAKEAVNASVFIPKFKHSPISTSMWNTGRAYIGHNRKKTVGGISDETAHPFVVDDTFAMVHNGTLHNHEKLAKGCAVDSQALAIHLQACLKEGKANNTKIPKIFEEAIGQVDGAFALAMYDQTRNDLYLTRNKERPLAIIEVDDAWYFMSEPTMGIWILSRNGYIYDKMKVMLIEEHELVTFDLDKVKMSKDQMSPKKYYLLPKFHQVGSSSGTNVPPTKIGGKADTSARTMGGPCGSKDFKRFRDTWLGKKIIVTVDDFVEEFYPTERLEFGNVTKMAMFAQSPAVIWMHSITIPVSNLKELGITKESDILGKKWVITIESASVNSNGAILIEGADAKPVVELSKIQQGIEGNKEFRASLSRMLYDDLAAMKEEYKFNGSPVWKVNAITAEMNWRNSIKTLEDADKKAKSRGAVLIQTKLNDRFVLKDSEGNVYYETAITVQ